MTPQIGTIIAKPTRECNAQCDYCCSPPMEENYVWSLQDFKNYFDTLSPALFANADWIWHGGEPMLLGPEFYFEAKKYADAKGFPEIRWAMQSNLLGYTSKQWKRCFDVVFEGRISTSFDPDESARKLKGSAKKYTQRFWSAADKVIADGFSLFIIGVYKNESVQAGLDFYEEIKARGEGKINLRYNYGFPAGRAQNQAEAISAENYGDLLTELYDRWIVDCPTFDVTPLDLMFKKAIGLDAAGHCPWTRSCGGRFLGLDPNGDVYNCSDFSDMGSPEYKFGNLKHNSMQELLSSPPAVAIRRRRFDLPASCIACEHFQECEGGCARDSVLFNNGLAGKFHYCGSWKRVFTRIKASILTGEADQLLISRGVDMEKAKEYVRTAVVERGGDEALIGRIQGGEIISPFGFLGTDYRDPVRSKGFPIRVVAAEQGTN